MTAKDTVNMRKFPKIVESDCHNIRCVYPLKQKQAAKLYDMAKSQANIRKLIVFGSSVTGKCHAGSDMDICIDANTTDGMKIYDMQRLIGDICDWNCDILMYNQLGERLKSTVEKEGVVIYEQLTGESKG